MSEDPKQDETNEKHDHPEKETISGEDYMKELKKKEEEEELDAIRIMEVNRPQGPGPGL